MINKADIRLCGWGNFWKTVKTHMKYKTPHTISPGSALFTETKISAGTELYSNLKTLVCDSEASKLYCIVLDGSVL